MNERELEIDLEPEIDAEDTDCVVETCEKCGGWYSGDIDDHECEPERDEEEVDEEPEETKDTDNCETIYCEPTCELCGADEGKCDYTCENSPNYEDFKNEPDPMEGEFEPSADFCWTNGSEGCEHEPKCQ